jgi:xanthine dehydrogenase accessory factor
LNVYEAIERYLEEEKKGVVATIVVRLGAAPRDVGAKMFVGQDGKAFGTVGGGSLEADVIRQILEGMGREKAVLVHYRMDGREVAAEGMLCGGDVDVLLEPVFPKHRDLYRGMRHCAKRGRRAALITRFGDDVFSKTLIDIYGDLWGDEVGGAEAEDLRKYLMEKKPVVAGPGLVVEPVNPAATLYIFGAGHVSQYLAKVARMVDFKVVVIDDREEFANRERFPEADEVVVNSFGSFFDGIEFGDEDYIVIVTRGHQHDALVLEKSLEHTHRYVGMIGSKRKVRIVLDHLKEKGVAHESLQQVHAPIGIDINSETPQEIAISIVAQIIKVRGEV